MTTDNQHKDIFISYARDDNINSDNQKDSANGWITKFVDELIGKYSSLEGSVEDIVFFDERDIPSGAFWRRELKHGVENAKQFIAFISPNYLKSKWCCKEWNLWVETEISNQILNDGAVTVYIVEVPNLTDEYVAAEAIIEQLKDQMKMKIDDDMHYISVKQAINGIKPRNLENVIDYYGRGCDAIFDELIKSTLTKLSKEIDNRHIRACNAANSEKNGIPDYNRKFTGRARELRDLGEHIGNNKTGVVYGINGLGGIGKTELALTYAHAYAHAYPGGRFGIPCENKKSLKEAVLCLWYYLEFNEVLTDKDKELTGIDERFSVICNCLKVRLRKGSVLLLLDNVDNIELFKKSQTDELTQLGSNIHLLATTREKPKKSANTWFTIHELSLDESLELFDKFREIEDDQIEAATELAKMLGGFTLGVELTAAYLEMDEEVTYNDMKDRMGIKILENIETYGNDKLTVVNIRWKDRSAEEGSEGGNVIRLEAVMMSLVKTLTKIEKRVLQYASLLPNESLALPWLEELIYTEYPELIEKAPSDVDSWEKIWKKLEGLTLIRRNYSETGVEEPKIFRIHRLLQEYIKASNDWSQQDQNTTSDSIFSHIYNRISYFHDLRANGRSIGNKLWEVAVIQKWLTDIEFDLTEDKDKLRVAGMIQEILGDISKETGNLGDCGRHYSESLKLRKFLAESDKKNTGGQRDLSVSYEKLGNVMTATGNLEEAKKYYLDGLEIARSLADSDKENAKWQRDLSVSYHKLGNVMTVTGNLEEAKKYYLDGLEIAKSLADSDKENAEWQHDLSVSYNKLGDLMRANGSLEEVKKYYLDDIEITRNLADSDMENMKWQRDLSVSYDSLGDLMSANGNLVEAKKYYLDGLEIRSKLTNLDKENAEWQRDISVGYDRLGDLMSANGNLEEAKRYYLDGLEIRSKLGDSDKENTGWQHELSVSYDRLGDLMSANGNLKEAKKYYLDGLEIRSKLAGLDKNNEVWQRDLSVSYNKLGDLISTNGNLEEAKKYYLDGLTIRSKLAGSDKENAGWQRDLSVSYDRLGDLMSAAGNLEEAKKYYLDGLTITKRLADSDKENLEWQRDQSVSYNNLGELMSATGNLEGAKKYYFEMLTITKRLADLDKKNSGWQRDLSVSYNNLGEVMNATGNLEEAKNYYLKMLLITKKLADSDKGNAECQRDLVASNHNMYKTCVNNDEEEESNKYLSECYKVLMNMVNRNMYLDDQLKDFYFELNEMFKGESDET